MTTFKKKDSPATTADTASQDAKRGPFKTLRVEDCSASIWARDVMIKGEPKRFYSVTFERAYKDRDGSRKYTRSFDNGSLGSVAALCHQASDVIADLEREVDLYGKDPRQVTV